MLIYKITNKINGKTYIGMTSFNMEKRWKEHIWESSSSKSHCYNTKFHKALRKYGFDKFEKEIIDESNDLNSLKKKEIYWIDKLNTYKEGYNSTLGGDGFSGKQKESHISKRYRSIFCIELNKKYRSLKHAEKETGVSKSSISECLSGRTDIAKGLTFRYSNNNRLNKKANKLRKTRAEKRKNSHTKPIVHINSGKIFNSIREASDFFNLDPSNVSKTVRGLRKQYKGHLFKFK